MILVFLVAFNIGSGTVTWVYNAEVTVDKAAGFCVCAQFIMTVIYNLTMEYMINSKLQAFGTFFLFGGISVVGFLFHLILVKETRGLSAKEKKTLYFNENHDLSQK